MFVGLVALLVVSSPGWDDVKKRFFDWTFFKKSFPDVLDGFGTTVKIFLVAQAIILVSALVLALLRALPGPVFFPLRALAIIYADVFRGIPTLLLIYLLGFGAPALGIKGVPTSPFFWGVIALVLVYTAYVAEVYRAGIESVHPARRPPRDRSACRRAQALRYVVLPQAVRRVIPPLLNDFIGLQKDTALVSFIGVIEVFRAAQIDAVGDVQLHALPRRGGCSSCASRSR